MKGDRAAPAISLPNGASAINETYGDWSVSCSIADVRKICVMSQAQGDKQTGQRLFAIELQSSKDGKTDGILLMPFGLKLDDGVKLKLDDQNLGQGARFSTCYPQGCVVPVSFPIVATDAMKKGTSLIVTATNVAGGAEIPTFKISLSGFTAAMNRSAELAK
ncbi:invasion associated locus B family protein [Agrobacterium tumefaciens]|uniref:invasion associated locus B family protein n=1 Tax=Agrobacterium tumefaciens TaxID=358 RepID=UPI00224408FD|nr:invasion associated locus B family protein [Agrobacterium tumefaciens]